jgi:serine/threonine protein kinase
LSDIPSKELFDIPGKTLRAAGLEIIRELGHGNQSTVHMVLNRSKKKISCVKRFYKGKQSPGDFAFMKEEYEVMKQCSGHPGIAEVFDIFQDISCFYIEMQMYQGGDFTTLRDHAVEKQVSLTEPWWGKIFKQCIDALAHLHAHGVVHCDVKEPNLMVKSLNFSEPQIALVDFGVAQRFGENRSVIYGTPGYIPPEVWNVKTWCAKGDMFSLGVVIFQMTTDRNSTNGHKQDNKCRIFVENTSSLREIKVATQTREPPFFLMPACHDHLTALARKLLRKDPQHRPSAAQVLADTWMVELQPQGRSNEHVEQNQAVTGLALESTAPPYDKTST